jgi:hypothetical protein
MPPHLSRKLLLVNLTLISLTSEASRGIVGTVEPGWVTVKQAQRMVNLSRQKLRRLEISGVLVPARVRGRSTTRQLTSPGIASILTERQRHLDSIGFDDQREAAPWLAGRTNGRGCSATCSV